VLELVDLEQIGHDIRIVARLGDLAWLKDK
jgi:hypothetical protein